MWGNSDLVLAVPYPNSLDVEKRGHRLANSHLFLQLALVEVKLSEDDVLVGYDDDDGSSRERERDKQRAHMALSSFRPYGLPLADSGLIHQILVH